MHRLLKTLDAAHKPVGLGEDPPQLDWLGVLERCVAD